MGTTIRSELSTKNKNWIEKERYYELKHFCMQYNTWKKAYLSINELGERHPDLASYIKIGVTGDLTAKCAIAKKYYSDRMEMIEKTVRETDPDLAIYIFKAVTNGYSYTYMRQQLHIPCSRDVYYEAYRRFFWLLNKVRE